MPKAERNKTKAERRADTARRLEKGGYEQRLPKVQAVIESDSVMEAAAKLYGLGFTRPKIARSMAHLICPNSVARNEEQLLASARSKLRRWENNKEFRDLVWQHAVVELDMATPQILQGVAAQGRRGRVDAAKLALEITGRHTSKEGLTGPIEIHLAPIPRPEPVEDHRQGTKLLDQREFQERRELLG